jgi:hypothetical protein
MNRTQWPLYVALAMIVCAALAHTQVERGATRQQNIAPVVVKDVANDRAWFLKQHGLVVNIGLNLVEAAKPFGLVVREVSYAPVTTTLNNGVRLLRAEMALQGEFGQLDSYVFAILADNPTVTLDALRIESVEGSTEQRIKLAWRIYGL